MRDLEKGIVLEAERWRWDDRKKLRKIQERELRGLTNFFICANIAAFLMVAIMAVVEHFTATLQPIITDKVVIVALGGIMIQAGTIILAAFKGLFAEK